jgi:hypothetical protein
MDDLVPGLRVNRWKRYGKDRLYVTTDDGETTIGWWDLVTDEGHPETRNTPKRSCWRWRAGRPTR